MTTNKSRQHRKPNNAPLDYAIVTVPVLFRCAGLTQEEVVKQVTSHLTKLGDDGLIDGYLTTQLKIRKVGL